MKTAIKKIFKTIIDGIIFAVGLTSIGLAIMAGFVAHGEMVESKPEFHSEKYDQNDIRLVQDGEDLFAITREDDEEYNLSPEEEQAIIDIHNKWTSYLVRISKNHDRGIIYSVPVDTESRYVYYVPPWVKLSEKEENTIYDFLMSHPRRNGEKVQMLIYNG